MKLIAGDLLIHSIEVTKNAVDGKITARLFRLGHLLSCIKSLTRIETALLHFCKLIKGREIELKKWCDPLFLNACKCQKEAGSGVSSLISWIAFT